MAASSADKITETKGSAGNPAVTTVSAARSVSGTSLTATALTNWPTDTQVHFITYSKNADGTKNNSSQLDWKGTVSSSTSITAMTLTNGTDTGNAIGDYIEMGPTASWAEDLYDGLTKEHDSTGAHDATRVMMLSGTQTITGDKTFTGTVTLPDGSVDSSTLAESVGNFGAGATDTPTITSLSGSLTTVSATGRHIQLGKVVIGTATITITTNGTAAGAVIFSLPVAAKASSNISPGFGRANAVSGHMLIGRLGSTTTCEIRTYDSNYPGADGEVLIMTYMYEAA